MRMRVLWWTSICAFLNSREGCHWPGRDWFRKDWCLRSAYPPVAAGLAPAASYPCPHPDQGVGISNLWAIWGPWLQHWCKVWYVSVELQRLCSDAEDFMWFCVWRFLCFFVAAVIVGGIDMMSQSLVLAKKPHIVIGKTTASVSFHILQWYFHHFS